MTMAQGLFVAGLCMLEAVVELPCSVAYCVPTAACHRCRSRPSLASTLTECKFCDRTPGAFSDSTQLERVPPPALLHACCRMGFQQPIPTGGRSWSTCSHGLSTLLHSDRLCYIAKATAAYHRQGMHITGYAHKPSHNNYRPTLTNNTKLPQALLPAHCMGHDLATEQSSTVLNSRMRR